MPSVESEGARIHYQRDGRGPAIVLVQGVGVIGRGWTPQLAALRERFTVITIDNRGIGLSSRGPGTLSIESMADDVLRVADAERLESFHLAGHSMGGIIAQQVSLTTPSRVLSLALLCTFLKGRQGATLAPALLWTAIRSRIGTRRMRRHAFVEIVLPAAYLAAHDRAHLCAELCELFGRDLADSPAILSEQLKAMARFDASSRLAELGSIRTLVVSGELDRIARPEYGRALAAAIPGSRYVEIAGGGHAVVVQSASVVNALLLEHLGIGVTR